MKLLRNIPRRSGNGVSATPAFRPPKDPSLDYLGVLAHFLRANPRPINAEEIMRSYESFPHLDAVLNTMRKNGMIQKVDPRNETFKLTDQGFEYAFRTLIRLQTGKSPIIDRIRARLDSAVQRPGSRSTQSPSSKPDGAQVIEFKPKGAPER